MSLAPRRRARLVLLFAAIALIAGLAGLLSLARDGARTLVAEQIDHNASATARALAGQIEQAQRYGIPLDKLPGIEPVFAALLAERAELAYLVLRSSDGRPMVHSSRIEDILPEQAQPLPGHAEATVRLAGGAQISAGYRLDYIDRELGAIALDLALALVIAFVLVRELTHGLWVRSALPGLFALALGHVRHIASGTSLTQIRLIIFAIALSEELLRPFFAVFAADLAPVAGLSPAMQAGLPVTAFMLTLALAQPLGPWLAQRADLRRALCLAAVAGAALLAVTGWLARDTLTLTLLRGAGGACYGLTLILAQTAIVRLTDSGNRARGLAEIAAAIVAAGIVGPAFGGVLADRFGYGWAFVGCGAAYLLSAVLALRLPQLAAAASSSRSQYGLAGFLAVLREPRARAVILGAAIPARLSAAALLLLLAPLYLQAQGYPNSMAGRVLMLYFITFMLSAPLVARWSDRYGRRRPFVIAGGLLSVAACAPMPWLDGLGGIALACALLGVGQAVLSAPQMALVADIFERHPDTDAEQALAAFRLTERLGSIAAAIVAARAIDAWGPAGAVGALGALLGVATVYLWLGLLPYCEKGTP
ncbi:MFS transporter [Chitinimonas lacunae]|uniref:MFS transporter n=1 Tax=Chitinimonas lacunae TaxID=1963018 RepID=A0ABV8MSL6_9NEIS